MTITDKATTIDNAAEKLKALEDLIMCAFSDATPHAQSVTWAAEIMMELTKVINKESNDIMAEAFMIGNRNKAEQEEDSEVAG